MTTSLLKDETRWLRPTQIVPSDLQPRKHFPTEGSMELVQSFKEHGFDAGVSRLLVRPLADLRIEHEKDSPHWFVQERSRSNGSEPDGRHAWQTIATAESDKEAQEKLTEVEEFELVCGERRWRAAVECNLESVPVVIKAIDDLEMLKLQLVENLQRESLNAMEEGMAYRRLEEMGQSREQIATSVGYSVQHVTDRLSLCRLFGTAAAEAIEAGKITPSHGRVLAKVPSPALRNELLQKVLSPPDGSAAPWSREALEQHIKLDYVRDLRDAKFDKEDPDLVPVEYEGAVQDISKLSEAERNSRRLWGGACTDCPFNVKPDDGPGRTGSKMSRARLCTNPECFRMKEVADYEKWSKGQAILYTTFGNDVSALSFHENAALWNESGLALHPHSEYVEIEDLPAESELRSDAGLGDIWKNLIKGQAVPIVLGRDANGKVHVLVTHELAKKAAHLNGHKIFRDSDRESRADEERSATAQPRVAKTEDEIASETLGAKKNRDAASAARNSQMAAIVKAAEGKVRRRMLQIPKPFWGYAALSLATVLAERGLLGDILARRSEPDGRMSEEGLTDQVSKMALGELFGFVVECLVAAGGEDSADVWAKLFGVDLKKVGKAEKPKKKGAKK